MEFLAAFFTILLNIFEYNQTHNYKTNVCGWMPWWNWQASQNEVLENKDLFATVSPFIFILEEDGSIASQVNGLEKLRGHTFKIIPTIYNDFDGERVSEIINSEEKTQKHINDILKTVSDYNVDGVEIDYEYLKAEDRDMFSKFIDRLSEALHQENKILSVTLMAKTNDKGTWDATEAQDWKTLGTSSDILKIMAYDFHWSESDPGPIAPLPWVREVVSYAKEVLPTEKTVLGLGLYGYEWENGNDKAKEYTLSQIPKLLEEKGQEVSWDWEVFSPYFKHLSHEVWFEDEKSILAKYQVAKKNKFSGVCLWATGGVPQKFYEIFTN